MLAFAFLCIVPPSLMCLGLGFWLGRWFELAGRDDEATPAGVHLVLDSSRPERAVPAANIVELSARRAHPAGPNGGAA